MNERIRELAEQAGYQDLPTVRLAFSGFNKEKFAELLVCECIGKIEDAHADVLDEHLEDWDRGYLGGLSTAIEVIKKHFGVES